MLRDTILQLLHSHSLNHPHRPALVDPEKGETITWERLYGEVQRFSHLLRETGLTRGNSLALRLPRSNEYFISLLSCLTSDITAIPLAHSLPVERSDHLLELTRPTAILNSKASFFGEAPLILNSALQLESAEQIVPYIIFTSGSTGSPKPVEILAPGVMALLSWLGRYFAPLKPLKICQFSSLAFDAHIWELLMMLSHGATLYVIPEVSRLHGSMIEEFLAHHEIDTLTVVPSVVSTVRAEYLPNFRNMIFCGDVCPPSLANQWLSAGKHVFNAYGPAEATICATIYPCSGTSEDALPIGAPLDHLSILVVDEQLNEVPRGEKGELLLSGVSVARGYRGLAKESAEKFIHYNESLGRCYRTGDLVSLGADGTLSFHGRVDEQLKIRGVRIESAEIRSIVSRHLHCSDACLRKGKGRDGREWLELFIEHPNASDREFCRKESLRLLALLRLSLLPELVPERLEFLPSFPRLPSGKPDISSMPIPLPLARNQSAQTFGSLTEFLAWLSGVLARDDIDGELMLNEQRVSSLQIATVASMLNVGHNDTNLFEQIIRRPCPRHIYELLDSERTAPNQLNRHNHHRPHFVLTGATGLLGQRCLDFLLRNTDASVTCLIRGASDTDAKARLLKQANYHDRELNDFTPRLKVYGADISRSGWSLDDGRLAEILNSATHVLHVAAVVNWIYPSLQLYDVNVGSVARLCLEIQKQSDASLHFVSSLGVVMPDDWRKLALFHEQIALADVANHSLGYLKSKWLAEEIIAEARIAGLNANVYRPSFIGLSAHPGIKPPSHDFLNAKFRHCASYKLLPDNGFMFNLLPADLVAEAIVTLALREPLANKNYHLTHPHPLSWNDVNRTLQSFFPELQVASYNDWCNTITNDSPLFPLLPFLKGKIGTPGGYSSYHGIWPEIACANTQGILGDKLRRAPTSSDLLAELYYGVIDGTSKLSASSR